MPEPKETPKKVDLHPCKLCGGKPDITLSADGDYLITCKNCSGDKNVKKATHKDINLVTSFWNTANNPVTYKVAVPVKPLIIDKYYHSHQWDIFCPSCGDKLRATPDGVSQAMRFCWGYETGELQGEFTGTPKHQVCHNCGVRYFAMPMPTEERVERLAQVFFRFLMNERATSSPTK